MLNPASPLDLTDDECDTIIERLTRTIPSGRERRRARHADEDEEGNNVDESGSDDSASGGDDGV